MSNRICFPESPRLLIVDDSTASRTILKRCFEACGFDCAEAEDGDQALRRIAEECFDVVLLDVNMPGLDGRDVLGGIRELRSTGELPVVLVTANDADEDVVEALASGANDYIVKPFHLPVVLARVNAQVDRRRTEVGLRCEIAELRARLEGSEAGTSGASEAA